MRAGPAGAGQKTSGFAVASFVLSLVGGVVLSVIFGAIALGRTGPTGQRGRWMAVTGLILSGVWVAAIAIAVVVDLQTDADRDATGEIVESGNVSAQALQVGDCLAEFADGSTTEFPAVPCSEPHLGEVIGKFDLAMADYPGLDELDAVVARECSNLLARYSTATFQEAGLELYYTYPEERSWPDDKQVVCVAAGDRTGSLADE